jgi:hypothetical protein
MFDFAASSIPLTISFGDNAEGMDMVLDIMRDAGAIMEMETIATGADIYRRDIKEGVLPDIFPSLLRTKMLLKASTKKPKGDDFMEVTSYITSYLDINTKMEYFVGENTPGVGIVTESQDIKITPETVADINHAAMKLGGHNIAYAIDELGLMFEAVQKDFPLIKAKYQSADEIKQKYSELDVLYLDADSASAVKKAIKPKLGCGIYLGKGYAVFEPLEEHNPKDKGLLLAAAMMLKYSGQNEAAWEVYEKASA